MALSPAPPRQTVHSVFPNTAFRSSSSRGFRSLGPWSGGWNLVEIQILIKVLIWILAIAFVFLRLDLCHGSLRGSNQRKHLACPGTLSHFHGEPKEVKPLLPGVHHSRLFLFLPLPQLFQYGFGALQYSLCVS